MKVFFAALLLTAASLTFAGCESDLPPEPKAEGPLRRGLTGQGEIIQPDKSEDPLIRENTRVGY